MAQKKRLLSPEELKYNATLSRSYRIWCRSLTDEQQEQMAITENMMTMIVANSADKKVVNAAETILLYLSKVKEAKNSENIFK